MSLLRRDGRRPRSRGETYCENENRNFNKGQTGSPEYPWRHGSGSEIPTRQAVKRPQTTRAQMDAAAEPATGAAVPRRHMGHMMSSEGSRPQHARRSCGVLFRRVQVTVPVAPVVRLSWVTLRSQRAARSDATAAEEPPDCSIGKRSARWRRGWESARGVRGEMCRSAALHVRAQECTGDHRRGVNPRSERPFLMLGGGLCRQYLEGATSAVATGAAAGKVSRL